MTEERTARAVLTTLVEPGHPELGRLVESESAADALDQLLSGRALPQLARRVRARLGGADLGVRTGNLMALTERLAARIVIPSDPEWPGAVNDLQQINTDGDQHTFPPLCLWVRGKLGLADVTRRAVAVVGARAATQYGSFVATELAHGLAERGWTVISGAAYGIDGAAHRGALSAGGVTVAVLACGIDTTYPIGHANLLERMATDGLVISEWPPGTHPARHRFLVRNRVIAALTAGTVVVEAARRSGSRVTARWASGLDRMVMAVPGPVTSALSAGTHELIREWGATLVTSAADIVAEVGSMGEALTCARSPETAEPPALQLDPRAVAVWDALPPSGIATEADLVMESGVAPREVRRALSTLLVHGLVEHDVGGYRMSAAGKQAATVRKPPNKPNLR